MCAARALPSSLLLLSRAFTVTQGVGKALAKPGDLEGLKDTLGALNKEAIQGLALQVGGDGCGGRAGPLTVWLAVCVCLSVCLPACMHARMPGRRRV
jgi:hypothetical protein